MHLANLANEHMVPSSSLGAGDLTDSSSPNSSLYPSDFLVVQLQRVPCTGEISSGAFVHISQFSSAQSLSRVRLFATP